MLSNGNLAIPRHLSGVVNFYARKGMLPLQQRKKRIASELYDKEKLSDAFLVVRESHQKLRGDSSKAIKWYTKSWEEYKSIENLEGQALAKINIGDVLDCNDDLDWST